MNIFSFNFFNYYNYKFEFLDPNYNKTKLCIAVCSFVFFIFGSHNNYKTNLTKVLHKSDLIYTKLT